VIRVDVLAEQPLHLGTRPDAGWLTDTHRFVPGSVLRGALASVWLTRNRPPRPDVSADADFLRLFESDVRFGPLYPGADALRPLSVFGCKYADEGDCRAFVHDAAFDGPAEPRCPVCGSPVEASKGRVENVQVVDHTRVQLDAHGRAVGGLLYTRRALAAGSRLTGLISGDLDDGLKWLTEPDLAIRLGGRRSTSGLATITVRAEPAPSTFTSFLPDQRRLVVRLISPGIFVDDHGRPTWLPDPAELTAALGVDAVVDAAFARPTVVSGWHAASNLPKPRDFAVAAGSVYVLRFGAGLPDHDGLHRLWQAGLGLRRVEGNGWIDLQRWQRPTRSAPSTAAPIDPVQALLVEIVAFGIGPTMVDDLRGWAQENTSARPGADARRKQLLTKERYTLLGTDARALIGRALELPPDQAADLAGRITDWLTTRTSTRGRSR